MRDLEPFTAANFEAHLGRGTLDRPFGLPRERSIVVDLPRPPSLNHIWKYSRKGVRPSPAYERWKAQADVLALLQRIHRGLIPIEGRFTAEILIAESKRPLDCDNAAKAPLDWAQSRRLIANDKFCRKLTIEFVELHRAEHGCRLTLTEIVSRETPVDPYLGVKLKRPA